MSACKKNRETYILENSNSTVLRDAVKEWFFMFEDRVEKCNIKCCCSKWLINTYTFVNKNTYKCVILGSSCCIKLNMIMPSKPKVGKDESGFGDGTHGGEVKDKTAVNDAYYKQRIYEYYERLIKSTTTEIWKICEAIDFYIVAYEMEFLQPLKLVVREKMKVEKSVREEIIKTEKDKIRLAKENDELMRIKRLEEYIVADEKRIKNLELQEQYKASLKKMTNKELQELQEHYKKVTQTCTVPYGYLLQVEISNRKKEINIKNLEVEYKKRVDDGNISEESEEDGILKD